jgi:hypothetical protein
MIRKKKSRAPAQNLPMQTPNCEKFLNRSAENKFIWF